MPAICPTNNTDCLLRALVDANSSFDWNPLNFGFTAALSVLGFVVTLFALFQALLAAGPGRLKASSSAVGENYGKKAHTRFDRVELRFRTVAKVPLIDLSELTEGSNLTRPAASSERRFALPGIVSKFFPGKEVHRSGAGWYRLLEDLKLEEYPFTTMDCETDYLPDDVQAAPAYATINDVLLLAMLAGCHTVTEADEGPRARGPNIQLDFRTHPFLGVVAVYQHYGVPAKISFDRRQLKSVMQSAVGTLNYCGERLSMVGFRDSDVFFALRSNMLMKAIENQRADCDHGGCASRKDVVKSWKDFIPSDNQPNWEVQKARQIITLLFADKLTGLGLYPSDSVDFHSSLTPLFDENGYDDSDVEENLKRLLASHSGELKASQAGAGAREHNVRPWKSDDNSSWFDLAPTTAGSHSQNNGEGSTQPSVVDPTDHRRVLPGSSTMSSKDLVLSYKALSYCASWMSDKFYFEDLKPENRAATCHWIDFQLCEVDSWLRTNGGQDSLCTALNIIKSAVDAGDERGGPMVQGRYQAAYDEVSDIVPEKQPKFPTKRFEAETLDFYGLDWSPDPVSRLLLETSRKEAEADHNRIQEDGNYTIVNGPISDDLMKELFDHTKKLRQEKREKAAKEKEGDRPAEAPPILADHSEEGAMDTAGQSSGVEDPEDEDWEGDSGNTSEQEQIIDRENGGPTKEKEKSRLVPGEKAQALEHARELSPPASHPEESAESEDPEPTSTPPALKPMETLLLYRAVLMACSLAARSDTSKLLSFKNRNQVVRVL
jgi:hypothetical protein